MNPIATEFIVQKNDGFFAVTEEIWESADSPKFKVVTYKY